ELAENIENQQWIVLDCRHDLANLDAGRTAYAAGHIPGAQFAHLDSDLSEKSPGPNGEFRGRHPLPERSKFIQTLRRWGINDDTQVIAYDAQGGMYAARLWWMLRWVGHQSVAVLDGGIGAWNALNLPMSTESVAKASGSIHDLPALVATVRAEDLVANIANPQRTVVDARAADRYRGENETMDPVGGHIPGAKNRFFKDNLQADGTFKPAEQLRAEFGALIDNAANSVMQCGSGVTACHNLLALEVAGMSGAALYPGSWSEWCSNPARPVVTGN
ncbi:MAG TPA: sulfurtransferase, partial [Burkholderiaceae bacterium]|nr:sulfurtransferase [Burkholderiaceae bacterium]